MKTPRAIGLALAMFAALLIPAAAISASKPQISESQRKEGMAKAPAIAQAMGLSCQVSDARLIGQDTKSKTAYYEIACGPNTMGYVLQAPAEGTPTAYSCIEADTPPEPGKPPSAPCMLPTNEDPKAVLGAMLQKAGVDCTPTAARGIGQTKSNTYMEVACQSGAGYILLASVPFDGAKPIQAQNCLMYDDADTNIKCALADKASRLAVVDKFAAAANNGCAVKDRRFVGMSKDESSFYEASCQDGKGYIYKVDTGGKLVESYDCAKATNILGGCTLTDARAALTEQAALYTRIAKEAGSSCDVDKYALFPAKPGEEIAELVCKDGSGAILMSKAGQKSVVLNCGRAPVAGYKCSLGSDNGYAALTADLKKFNYNSCQVSASRVIGKTEAGDTFVEVGCADGLKGYVLDYSAGPDVQPVKATGCAFAGNCKLPGNV